jgi:hypothetical protein
MAGIAFINTGGIVSFGPPVGVPLLAQSKNALAIIKTNKNLKKEILIFVLLKNTK